MDELKRFSAGLAVGVGVIGVEIAVFVGDTVMAALKSSPLSTNQTASIFATYSTGMVLLLIAGIIQGLLIGYFAPISFSIGYVTGDFFMIAIFTTILSQTMPSVLIGMVIALIAVLIGFALRMLKGNQSSSYQRYDRWY